MEQIQGEDSCVVPATSPFVWAPHSPKERNRRSGGQDHFLWCIANSQVPRWPDLPQWQPSIWSVVWNIFYFSGNIGNVIIPFETGITISSWNNHPFTIWNIFQRGRLNHQPGIFTPGFGSGLPPCRALDCAHFRCSSERHHERSGDGLQWCQTAPKGLWTKLLCSCRWTWFLSILDS